VQPLTTQATDRIHQLAQRYGVSTDAVMSLFRAVAQGNGTAAQFNHPELGGMGQWMRGGMTMVGNLFDTALKGKVEGLCSELSLLLAEQSLATGAAGPSQPLGIDSASTLPPGSQAGGVVLPRTAAAGVWWPEEMGDPAASGSQNEIRYAYFPRANRLLIADRGQVTIYNTLNYAITGLSQQQGPGNSLVFTGPGGTLRLADLPVISIIDEVQNPAGPALE
jgi:hypothetical protein